MTRDLLPYICLESNQDEQLKGNDDIPSQISALPRNLEQSKTRTLEMLEKGVK